MNSSTMNTLKNRTLFSDAPFESRINMWAIKCSEIAEDAIAHGVTNFKHETVIIRDPDIYKNGADRIVSTAFGYILPDGTQSAELWVNPNEALAWGYAMIIDMMEAEI
jgi:hypothetical protein